MLLEGINLTNFYVSPTHKHYFIVLNKFLLHLRKFKYYIAGVTPMNFPASARKDEKHDHPVDPHNGSS